jgi:two-component system sensor histidine kinase RegB
MSYKSNVELLPTIPAATLRWLVRVRWAAVVGQLAAIAIARVGFDVRIPVSSLVAIVAVAALTNLALSRRASGGALLITAVLGLDTLELCALLCLTGGPSNPLSVLFLVQITIAALVLRLRLSITITALSLASYMFLFFVNVPLPHVHHPGMDMSHMTADSSHLQGMFVGFALAAALINYFVSRVATALRQREAELALAERAAAANERLASLSTLAAGAAHELGTPLGTIAVAAKELERAAKDAGIAEDARLIRQEVDRCRHIVQQMSARAPGQLGEASSQVPVEALLSEVRSRLDESRVGRLDVQVVSGNELRIPVNALAQVLVSLVKNAFDASADAQHVKLVIEAGNARTSFAVIDEGKGISAEELEHVGEPFFTTKSPGAGMGLGVFLARAFADRFGGGLTLQSEPKKGTRAILELPTEPIT